LDHKKVCDRDKKGYPVITVLFNRKTGECLAFSNSRHVDELFETGRRDRADFDKATSSGFIKIQQRGKHLDVTTVDDPSILS